MFKVIESFWFNGALGTVGLVIVDTGREVKAYAGLITVELRQFLDPTGNAFVSHQPADEATIVKWGAPFPLKGAMAMSETARQIHECHEQKQEMARLGRAVLEAIAQESGLDVDHAAGGSVPSSSGGGQQ